MLYLIYHIITYYCFTIYMYSKQMASCVISYCFQSDGKEKGLEPFVYGKN